MNETPYESRAESAPQNPYQRAERPVPEPDLDANAPYLRSVDVQRLNRKALLFLGGIVLLLLAVAFWIFSTAVSGQDDEARGKARGEQLVIPAAPKDLPELPPEQPAMVAEPDLPPLPIVDEGPAVPSFSLPKDAPAQSVELTLRDRRIMDASGSGRSSSGQSGAVPGVMSPEDYARLMTQAGAEPDAAAAVESEDVSSAKPLYNPNTLLLRGTYIRCVLESRVITDVPGYTSCVVTEPVYSVNGKRLLLPRGSKVMGSYDAEAIIGERAAIVWDRITTPTGMDVNMRSPGTDMLGAAGNPGHYSAHWAQRISSALLISMLSDAFKYAGAKHGPQETSIVNGAIVQNPYESNTARTMERLANMALDRSMARPPTVTIDQGTIVNVYVARDVDFSAVMR
ncbi:type IV secretion system protein VirB10 [Pseudoxanthomonas sp. CF385]|uniref:TrbI/VirB10 family protein n=1 Tax=Pseudoxanthomonas sp. CF385 TaxID=1881042 RepID=UPI00088B9BCD|nr:TrbI/VirB10 family protein [Pseudoxanthomonas sp. CF385]SDQ36416.1 type IV secretion system protein VirB10 [Pseudoxanthomonas sp. CF385]